MATFDDYINSLEGQEDIDAMTVASKLHELHTHELSTREAKIAELNTTVAGRDSELTKRDADLAKQKAMNFDLAMQIPGSANYQKTDIETDEPPSGSNIKIGDLFNDKVRNRHGLR